MSARAQCAKKCSRVSDISQYLVSLRDKMIVRYSELRKEKRLALLEQKRTHRDRQTYTQSEFEHEEEEVPVDLDSELVPTARIGMVHPELLQCICSELELDFSDDLTLALLLEVERQVVDEELAVAGAPVEPDWEEYFMHLTLASP